MNASAFISHFRAGCFVAFRRMIVLLVLAGIAGVFLSPPVNAQTHSRSANSSNRFLFIIDTSSAMKPHLADIDKAIGDLLDTDMSGQLHNGDTIGLWTYNSDVHGEFSMQTWERPQRGPIALQMVSFLGAQKFHNRSKFGKVLTDLFPLVRNSDILTVFIISNGEIKMAGTPFDADFNTQYKLSLKESEGAHLPVVSVLQAKGGRLFRFTLNPMPWPVVVPELPIPIRAIEPVVHEAPAPVAPVTPVAKAAAPAVVPSLMFVGPNGSHPGANLVTDSNAPPRLFPRDAGAPALATLPLPPPPNFKPAPPNTNGLVIPQSPPASVQQRMKNMAQTVTPGVAVPPSAIPALPLANGSNSSPVLSNGTVVKTPVMGKTFQQRNVAVEAAIEASNKLARAQMLSSNAFEHSMANPKVAATNKPAVDEPAKSLKQRALAFITPADGTKPKSLLVMAGILVLIALLLIVVMVRRSRNADASLISRSMKK